MPGNANQVELVQAGRVFKIFISLLDAGLLVAQWPVLRTLVGPAIRTVWETAFTELATAARPAAAA
ncbi:hypothetical protein [Kitasatospora sp. NPDC087271]|uniref:hypothetical protein n=1 Tax=Kitasatospora sp. NPDC087271 TaxID=3364067 RepID=UPI00380AD573